jgi:hypothetical protein
MVMPVLTRARYLRLGRIFHPEFVSMFADNDFFEEAYLNGVLVDGRDMGVFPHKHYLWDKAVPVDVQYRAQNSPDAWKLGDAILGRRRAERSAAAGRLAPCRPFDQVGQGGPGPVWPVVPGASVGNGFSASTNGPRTIALCLTGEHFSGDYLDAILTLYNHLTVVRGFEVVRLRNYRSNVYVTRSEIWDAFLALDPRPEFMLWIDDDNLLSPSQFDALLADIDGRPDLDGVVGWCWIHDETHTRFQVSCGTWGPDSAHWIPFHAGRFPVSEGLQDIEVTGFPCVLLRGGIADKVGPWPFVRDLVDHRLPYGIRGEDLAFCRACIGAARLAVDPRVRVPHLKTMQVLPQFTDTDLDDGTPVRLAVMMRVKNEARWIGRVIDSVKMLGPVFVLDDGSTDATPVIASQHGATVFHSPFAGLELDEARDKNWLLERVRDGRGGFEQAAPAHAFEWVLCIDGDEELEPAGAEKILRACRVGMADAYAVRFLYCWDAPDLVRLDRWYSTFSRYSLFRLRSDLSFRSLYSEKGVQTHSGLHTGNAPLGPPGQSLKGAALNVYLLHYGYMTKEDRLRKYQYYNAIDPDNEFEDCYRHIVQGDIPEIPADAVLRHAGPLDVRRLPASMAPKFNAPVEALAGV